MVIINTSKGDIHLELDTINTPLTAENFLAYVREGFYNDTIFHRVISGFMIQGGGLTKDMDNKATKAAIQNEAKHAKPNKRGSISMARTSNPHSATSQFFINLNDNTFLNYTGEDISQQGYCVFGEVVSGMDVVDAIAAVKTGQSKGHGDVPVEPVFIHSIIES